ncbi:hypothetical protein MMC13_006618 [Lambiella insularis]|nr:hypothetical protein [Lambiella insularis]
MRCINNAQGPLLNPASQGSISIDFPIFHTTHFPNLRTSLTPAMKILTVNFLTCAVKACKSSPASFPLHFRDAELEQADMEYNPVFLRNILPRIEWEALKVTATELGFTSLPPEKPDISPVGGGGGDVAGGVGGEAAMEEEEEEAREKVLRDLHKLLLETQVREGKMVCGNCGHEYRIKEGIANFLLPNHLV